MAIPTRLFMISNMKVRLWLAVVIASVSAVSHSRAQERTRPNVVVFVADDLGAMDLGYAGSKFHESPNLDALAKRGCVFTSAYAAAPVCSPTRAALITGRWPARVGVTDFIGGPQPDEARRLPRFNKRPMVPAAYRKQLPLEETTIGEAFREAGYATMYAGKWHLGGKEFAPDQQGFDTVFGAGPQGGPGKGGYFAPFKVPVDSSTQGEHLDLRLARDTAEWIGKQKPAEKPFLACFALFDVHVPLMAPQATVEYFEQKRQSMNLGDEFGEEGASKARLNQSHAVYAAMIKTMDEAVGIVIKQLEAQGLMDDTIILFTSDNGGLATAEGSPTSNLPLRAGKGWAYEGGLRVPQIAVIPGVTRGGSSCGVPTITTDVFPTLLAACGLPPRPNDHLDGISILPALRNETLADRDLFWHYPHYGNQGGSPFSAIGSGDFKLIVFHNPAQGVELYDLAADAGEKNNLAAARTDDVASLRVKLDAWKKSVGAVDATKMEKRE